jgi:hypothetical protein
MLAHELLSKENFHLCSLGSHPVIKMVKEEEKMEKSSIRPHRLLTELSQLFNLETSLDTVLAVSMYKLNQYMDSERSSIFVFDPFNASILHRLALEK